MAAPDCSLCAMMGYRSCDKCGGVVEVPSAFGFDVCAYCREDARSG